MRPTILRRLLLIFIVAGVWLASPPHVLAVGVTVEDMLKQQDGQQAPVPEVGQGDESLIWSLLQLIFALGIIVALIYLFVRFLSMRTIQTRGHMFQSLGTQTVAANRSVHLLAVGDKVYLLGIGEDINVLDKITDAAEIERLKELSDSQAAIGNPVSGMQTLIDRLRARTAKGKSQEVQYEDLSFDAALREKLDALKQTKDETRVSQDGQER